MKKSYKIIIAVALVVVLLAGIGVVVINSGNYEEMTGWQRTAYAMLNRDKIINTDYVGAVSDYQWTAEEEYKLENTSIVMKEAGEDFVIMNITDIHLSDYTQDAPLGIRTFDSIRVMVEKHQPDLITLSGDLFWSDSMIYSAHRLTEFMDSLGIPWAPIFGNHEEEGNTDKNYLADVFMTGEYCLMQKGDPDFGVGNYVVNICEEVNGKKQVVHSLIMMDSHNGAFEEGQVDWYAWAAEGVKAYASEDAKSTVVLHVPIAQYQYAWDAAWDVENETWKEGFGAFGAKGEDVVCDREEAEDEDELGAPVDWGLFAKVKEVGTTTNIICGHDHVNNFSVEYEGVRLTYSLRLGLGAYFDMDSIGVTTLTIKDDGSTVVEHDYRYDDK